MSQSKELNAELLLDTYDHIRLHPEEHDQRNWANINDPENPEIGCGTTLCFAGHACLRAGLKVDLFRQKVRSADGGSLGYGNDHISQVAKDILGLDNVDAIRLFFSMSSILDEGISRRRHESEILAVRAVLEDILRDYGHEDLLWRLDADPRRPLDEIDEEFNTVADEAGGVYDNLEVAHVAV